MIHALLSLYLLIPLFAQTSPERKNETELIGVYQGRTLFIQNPYRPDTRSFCIKSVYINNQKVEANYQLSAIKLDFENNELYTPVTIRIVGSDSLCQPIVINPDAIHFHTTYKFTDIQLSDTALVWRTEGERQSGKYLVEKYDGGIWNEVYSVEAKTLFEVSEYEYAPNLEEGGNKFRVKYDFGNGRFLYSNEVVYDFYPEPVTLTPRKTNSKIVFSRSTNYEIYDQNSELVLTGNGREVDVRRLKPGDYVVFFDGRDPQIFTRERY